MLFNDLVVQLSTKLNVSEPKNTEADSWSISPYTGTILVGKIAAGYIFRDFARFFFPSDWPQCILRKDDRALVKFPSE